MNADVLTREHPTWPERLNELGSHAPPKRLFVEGLTLDAGAKTIAVVGTRRPTAAGVEAAECLTRGLVEAGFTIVSGLAVGIDTVAHRTALDCDGYSIAILGCGLDVDYPIRNNRLKEELRARGTLVSEYPPGTPAQPYHFPLRNRIVAGLATGVLVIEGGLKSGALITARLAIDANRSVWAVPGSIRNPMAAGPNELIRTGQAALVTDIGHVFEEVAPALVWETENRPAMQTPDLRDEEIAILHALDDVPLAVDRITRVAGLKLGKVGLALSRLEVRGLAARRGVGYEITQSGGRVRDLLAGRN